MTKKKQPTEEQLEAVCAYAKWAGRSWKSMLSADWMRARSDWSGDWAPLQQLRNSFGPSWLVSFRLPKPKVAERRYDLGDVTIHLERTGAPSTVRACARLYKKASPLFRGGVPQWMIEIAKADGSLPRWGSYYLETLLFHDGEVRIADGLCINFGAGIDCRGLEPVLNRAVLIVTSNETQGI